MEPLVVVLLMFSAVMSASLATAAGFGAALIMSPLLAIFVGPKEAVLTVVLLGTLTSTVGAASDIVLRPRTLPLNRQLLLAWLGAGLALFPAAAIVRRLPERFLIGIVGALVLVWTFAAWRGRRISGRRPTIATIGAGAMSQTASVIGGLAGPPMVLHGLAAGWDPPRARTTHQVYFVPSNLATAATVGLGTGVRPVWNVLIGDMLGVIIGLPLRTRIDAGALQRLMLSVAGVAGAAALLRAVAG